MRQWITKGLGIGVACLAAVCPVRAQDAGQLQQAYQDYANKKWTVATKELQAITKKSPDSVQAHEMLASIYLGQNQIPAAVPELEAVVRLNPKEVASYRDNLGVAYQQAGEYPKAVRLYQAALLQTPADPMLLFSYAVVLEKSGRHTEAAAAFSNAAALGPKDAKAPLYAGLLDHQLGNDTQAVPLLKSALTRGTDQKFAAYTALAEAAAAAKNTADAIGYYTQGGAANPTDFMTQANLGILEQNSGNAAAAEAAYRKAVMLKSADPKAMASIHSDLALLLESAGKYDEAAPYLEAATQLDPTNAAVQVSLAMVYEKQGRKAHALAAYQKALTLNADNNAAKEGVGRLSK